MEERLTKRGMPEKMYRASRCFRTLGNPTAYLIVRCLGSGRKSPSQLGRELEMSMSAISATLRHLRQLDLVRYETLGARKEYWVKETGILAVMDAMESWVESCADSV